MDVPMLAACRGHQGFNIAMGGGLIQDVPYFLGEEVKAGRIAQSRVTGNSGGTATTHRVYRLEDIISADGTLIPYSGAGAAPFTLVSCDVHGCSRVQVDGVIHSGGTSYHRIDAGQNSGILPNSKWLYNIVGANYMPAVATAHHQSVNPQKLGAGITIVSYSTDGIVEAIEHQDSLFALGVQWHPERDAGGGTSGIRNGYIDPDSSNVFMRALVQYAGIHMDRQVAPNFVDPYAAYNDKELSEEKPSAAATQKDDTVIITITNTFLENGNEVKLYFRAEGKSTNDAEVTVKLSGSSPFEVVLGSKSLANAGLKDGVTYAINYTNGKNVFGTTTFSKGFKFDYKDHHGCNVVHIALALLAIIPFVLRRKG
jgi:gamma-glutamyl-gamma-aminobutyrate hydrolase PuuD